MSVETRSGANRKSGLDASTAACLGDSLSLQMRSQSATLLALSLGAACAGKPATPQMSSFSPPANSPDLSLQGVAFARLSEGRVVARGTASHLDYRRAGGGLVASRADGILEPEPGSGLAPFGTLHFTAPRVEGEVANRRGTATGGVNVETGRGDRAYSESATYDGLTVRSTTKVFAQGPGYFVQSNGMVAQADGSAVHLTRGVTGQMQMESRR